MQDLVNVISSARSLSPAARTASANGAGVDLQGFDSATLVVCTGTITDGTHTITVEESDDNSVFTAVAAADLIGAGPAVVAANDDVQFEFGYKGTKRYVRAVATVAGATTGGIYAVCVVRGHPRKAPKV